MRRLRVRPEATRDIEESTFFYTMEDGDLLGERFRQAVETTIAWLLANPEAGSPRKISNPRLEDLRVWPVRGFKVHLVFYRPCGEGIEVIRVLHGARDIISLLEDSD